MSDRMNNLNKKFNIISFTADEKQYYPASMKRQSWMPKTYVKHTDIEIPMGQSRYGGPVMDLPVGLDHPEGLRFAGQLLLQIGENGFNDEGIFSVLISREDLINRNFDNYEFAWGQS